MPANQAITNILTLIVGEGEISPERAVAVIGEIKVICEGVKVEGEEGAEDTKVEGAEAAE
jgi:hypothetical protein